MNFTAHELRIGLSPGPEHHRAVLPHEHQQKSKYVAATASVAICAVARKTVRQPRSATLRPLGERRCRLPTEPARHSRGSLRHSICIGRVVRVRSTDLIPSAVTSTDFGTFASRRTDPNRHILHGTWDKILFIISCEMARAAAPGHVEVSCRFRNLTIVRQRPILRVLPPSCA